ncbi:maleylpyruvate isomerase family mycothiol-dependent enzyme [Nocardioides limicola]|uniref:maleylpyruvate isomerase family mycothiol-dependent enzyme n=1 Tax=Nocardioides limicola TaxID=2803368 RepID=UPI00193C3A4D|nr:maleylpyruvate isomerase family mycothiol-dependent enzyme [Nocardioides sp. DJM-14]
MTQTPGGATTLLSLIEVWWQSVTDFLTLLDQVPEELWDTSTDLAGWDVRAVAAHVTHLESILAGGPHETAEVPEADHVKGPMGQFTEIGVINRRNTTGAEIVAELRAATRTRYDALLADPPTDGTVSAPGVFGAIGWPLELLLRNRPLDVWMHEQDIRRAIDRPGNLTSPGAEHTLGYLLGSTGYVFGKVVGAPVGASLVLEVDGCEPVSVAVGDDGRAGTVPLPEDPTVRLRCDRESYIVRAGGRRPADRSSFEITGDATLGARVIDSLAVTP